MTVPVEVCWLLACLRSLDGHELPYPPAALRWDRVLTAAEAEGLAPALGLALKARAPAAMPTKLQARASRHLTESTARHLILARELGRLVEAFDRAALPVIPLKGPALAELLYERPAVRPCTDLDLLIHRDALVDVDRLLQGEGYRRVADDHSWCFDVAYDRATLYESSDGVRVDLHWSLLSDPRFFWNEAESLSVWQRAIKIPVGGREVSSLCPEDLVLYLGVHLSVHHGLAGLLWYWDLARLLERWGGKLQWDVVVARASRWRVRRAVFFALLECERFFGVSAPPATMSRLRARGPRAALLHWLVLHREADQLRKLEHLIALLLVDRGRGVIGSLARVVFPSSGWLRARYEGVASSLLACYLAHWRRMATIASAATVVLIRRSSASASSPPPSDAREPS